MSCSYTTWDGATWSVDGSLRRVAGPPHVVATTDGPTRTDRVRVERRADGVVWAPGPVLQVDGPGRVFVDQLGAVRARTAPGYTVTSAAVRPSVEQYVLADGRRINLLAAGRVVNLAVAEGHPASVMDMSFANQALAVEHLVVHAGSLERRVHAVPDAIDRRIARLKLETMGISIDRLTEDQAKYLASWNEGT